MTEKKTYLQKNFTQNERTVSVGIGALSGVAALGLLSGIPSISVPALEVATGAVAIATPVAVLGAIKAGHAVSKKLKEVI